MPYPAFSAEFSRVYTQSARRRKFFGPAGQATAGLPAGGEAEREALFINAVHFLIGR